MHINSPLEKLIIVSNRLPLRLITNNQGTKLHRSDGGLVSGLRNIHRRTHCLWLGILGYSPEQTSAEQIQAIRKDGLVPLFVDKPCYRSFYEVVSNSCLWPLFHYFTESVCYSSRHWHNYTLVNGYFADEILKIAGNNDKIWIHDYHLLLLPQMLRARGCDLPISYFHHTPFPSYEVFRLLPTRSQVLRGMLGADHIGFHTIDYKDYFLDCVSRILGIQESRGKLHYENRQIKVGNYPLEINNSDWQTATLESPNKNFIEGLKPRLQGKIVLLGVDRLDYSKGIPQRLKALRLLLRKRPELRERLIHIEVNVPSRTGIKKYQSLKSRIEQLAEEINAESRDGEHKPLYYFFGQVTKNELQWLYKQTDIMLVTPLRDGLNLVAKEYLATKGSNGKLILSEFAGAVYEERDALLVNPFDYRQITNALQELITDDNPVSYPEQSTMTWFKKILHDWDASRPHDLMDSGPGRNYSAQLRKAHQIVIVSDITQDDILSPFLVDLAANPQRPALAFHSLAYDPAIDINRIAARCASELVQMKLETLANLILRNFDYLAFAENLVEIGAYCMRVNTARLRSFEKAALRNLVKNTTNDLNLWFSEEKQYIEVYNTLPSVEERLSEILQQENFRRSRDKLLLFSRQAHSQLFSVNIDAIDKIRVGEPSAAANFYVRHSSEFISFLYSLENRVIKIPKNFPA